MSTVNQSYVDFGNIITVKNEFKTPSFFAANANFVEFIFAIQYLDTILVKFTFAFYISYVLLLSNTVFLRTLGI